MQVLARSGGAGPGQAWGTGSGKKDRPQLSGALERSPLAAHWATPGPVVPWGSVSHDCWSALQGAGGGWARGGPSTVPSTPTGLGGKCWAFHQHTFSQVAITFCLEER